MWLIELTDTLAVNPKHIKSLYIIDSDDSFAVIMGIGEQLVRVNTFDTEEEAKTEMQRILTRLKGSRVKGDKDV